jgi:hypothetical protein
VRYVYEPFNLNWVSSLQGELSYFRYLTPASAVSSQIEAVAQSAFSGKQVRKQLVRAAYRGYLRTALRRAGRVVVKDPTAPLMTAWLAEKFDATPVIIIRHPCGFASSIGKLDWEVSVRHFLRQPALMKDHLGPYADIMERAASDIWLTRGAVWAAIHRVLLSQVKQNPNWIVCRYEDLCNSPVEGFVQLAGKLNITLDSADKKRILSKSAKNKADPGSTYKISAHMPEVWRQRLSLGQVDAVEGIVREFGFADYEDLALR